MDLGLELREGLEVKNICHHLVGDGARSICSPYGHSNRRELAPSSAGIASVKKRRRCASRFPLVGLRQTRGMMPR